MPLESPTALEVTHEVTTNQEAPILSNAIHYSNVNQNTVMGIQHFNNHAQCVE